MRTYMRRKTRLAPIANVTKENEETVIPRRLVPCTGGDDAAIIYRVEDSENDIRSATLQKEMYLGSRDLSGV